MAEMRSWLDKHPGRACSSSKLPSRAYPALLSPFASAAKMRPPYLSGRSPNLTAIRNRKCRPVRNEACHSGAGKPETGKPRNTGQMGSARRSAAVCLGSGFDASRRPGMTNDPYRLRRQSSGPQEIGAELIEARAADLSITRSISPRGRCPTAFLDPRVTAPTITTRTCASASSMTFRSSTTRSARSPRSTSSSRSGARRPARSRTPAGANANPSSRRASILMSARPRSI